MGNKCIKEGGTAFKETKSRGRTPYCDYEIAASLFILFFIFLGDGESICILVRVGSSCFVFIVSLSYNADFVNFPRSVTVSCSIFAAPNAPISISDV